VRLCFQLNKTVMCGWDVSCRRSNVRLFHWFSDPNEVRRQKEEIQKKVVAAKTTREDRPSIRESSIQKIASRIHQMGTPPNTDRSPLTCKLCREEVNAFTN
jgi:hypothetical protein